MTRCYYKIPLEGGAIQYQVVTPVGFHWRHVAVVTVKDGKAGRAERYFFSTRASAIIVPFEVMGKNFMLQAMASRRTFRHAANHTATP